jgi:hypothetical protein
MSSFDLPIDARDRGPRERTQGRRHVSPAVHAAFVRGHLGERVRGRGSASGCERQRNDPPDRTRRHAGAINLAGP